MLEGLKDTTRIMLRTWSGKIGIILLVIEVILALYAVAAYYPAGMRQYEAGKAVWGYYYPYTVPPCWATSNKFPGVDLKKADLHNKIEELQKIPDELREIDPDTYKALQEQLGPLLQTGYYTIIYSYYEGEFTIKSNGLPSDVRLLLTIHVPFDLQQQGKVLLLSGWMFIERPDGLVPVIFYQGQIVATSNRTSGEVLIYGNTVQGKLMAETLENYRNSLWIANTFGDSLKQLYKALGLTANISSSSKLNPSVLFATAKNGKLVGLRGTYKVKIGLYALALKSVANQTTKELYVDQFELKLMPNCYGFFGTDNYGRPIGLGLLLGLPYAFLLGFTVTFVSTFIGAIYGTLAGYWKDLKGEALMRVADIMLSLPFLPILIAISYAFGTITLKSLALIMIALSWAGPVIVVRSMALQISEQPYIEAAKAVGVPTKKIIFKHIFPQIYPYTMAIAVLSIPGIIVAEASLALLGFGDPSAPTWGKMLQNAYASKAVTSGWWWMYIFPGLALVVFSATFLLIGRALEPIVAPKLQR